MNKITLSKTHQRLISSLLFVLEQKLERIEHIINQVSENGSYIIDQDLTEQEKTRILRACFELKNLLMNTSVDLNIKRRHISQIQYINTIQSHMWENVIDAFSDKMTGYGNQVKAKAKTIDPYIQKISDLTDQLKL